jgi:hypothetical protein
VARDGGERGRNWTGHTRESSVYTTAMLHPVASAVAIGVCAAVIGQLMRGGVTRMRSRPGISAALPGRRTDEAQ